VLLDQAALLAEGHGAGFEDRTAIRSVDVPTPSSYLASTFDIFGSYLNVFVNGRNVAADDPGDMRFDPDFTTTFTYDVVPMAVVGDSFRFVNHTTFADQARGSLAPTRLVVSLADIDDPDEPGETGEADRPHETSPEEKVVSLEQFRKK